MARSFELWSIEFAAPIFGCEGSWQKIQFAPPSYLGSEFLLGRRGTWVSSGHSFNLRSRRTMSDNSRNLFFWLSRLPERRRRTEGKEAQSFSFQSIWLSFGEIPSGSHSGGFHITDSIWLSFEKIPSVSPSGRFHLLSFGEIPSGPPSGRFHLALLQGDFIWLPLSRIPFNRFHLAFLREDSMCSPSRRFHLNLLRWDSICLSFGRFHPLLWGDSIWLSFREIPSGSHSGGFHITDSIWLSFEKIPSVSPSGRFHLLSFGEIPSGPPSGRFHLALLQGDFIWLPLSRIPFNRFHLAFLREDSMCSPSRRFHLNLLRWDSICLSFGRFHPLLWGDSIWLSFREIPSGSHSGRYHLALLHGEIPSGSHLGGYCIWLSFAQIPSGPPSE